MIIAICDDEKFFHDQLKELLKFYSVEKNLPLDIYDFFSGKDLLVSDKTFDIIILDYIMENIDGIETIRTLHTQNHSSKIIFASNYPNIVFESIKYNIFRFLVKPVEKEELFEALDSALKKLLNNRKILVNDTNIDRNIYILEKDIVYAQADNVYSIIIAKSGIYRYKKNLSNLQKSLTLNCFCRTNRSFLVNLHYIDCYSKSEILLKNGHRATISRGHFKDFQNKYFSFLKNNYENI